VFVLFDTGIFYEKLSVDLHFCFVIQFYDRVLLGKPEGRRPLGRPRRRWKDNIKMDLQEVGGGSVDWMERTQDRGSWRALVGTVMNFRVP
jgi:hypothetical protein